MKNKQEANLKRYSLEEIKKMRSQTNWARLYSEELLEKQNMKKMQKRSA